MSIFKLLESITLLTAPPSGSINVRRGEPIAGEYGNWTPCAILSNGSFYASVFQPGRGNHQICALDTPYQFDKDALRHAVQLAVVASGAGEIMTGAISK